MARTKQADRKSTGGKAVRQGFYNEQSLFEVVSEKAKKDGKVFLRLPQFLQLLKNYYQQAQIAEHSDSIPTSSGYLIQDIQLQGQDIIYSAEHKDTHAHFTATYIIDILDKQLPNVITDSIFHTESYSKKEKKEARSILQSTQEEPESWTCITLLSNTIRKLSLTNWKVTPKDNTIQLEAYVGVYSNNLVLLCNSTGVVQVDLEFDYQYAKIPEANSLSSPKQLVLNIPQSVKNRLQFKIQEEDLQVKVTPTLHTNALTTDGYTLVSCEIPPTGTLSLQWTPQQVVTVQQELEVEESESDKEDVEEKKVPVTITSEQNVSHAIGEGLVKSTAKFNYSIANGSITTLDIQIETYGKPFKVLNVSGTGIKKWDVFNEQSSSNEENEDLLEAPTPSTANRLQNPTSTKKVIKINLSYGVERNYNLTVDTELEMGNTSAITNVPIFSTQNVTREKGSLAVVARTNVEIKEDAIKYLQRVDPTELPSHGTSPYPILHAYKFLESSHELKLNVTRHDDASVLSACIEKCDYRITYSQGRLMHDIKMKLKNTGKQYLRVRLPDTSGEIYSTIVDEQAVKPSSETIENDRYILLPLSKKSGEQDMTAQIIFISPVTVFSTSGTLSFELARFDMPTSRLFATLVVPDEYDYSEFEGNVKEVPYFEGDYDSANLNGKLSAPRAPQRMGGRRSTQSEKKERRIQKAMEEMEEVQMLASDISEMVQEQGMLLDSINSNIAPSSYDAGVKSVKFTGFTGVSGKTFLFSKYLIPENLKLDLSVHFKKIELGWFQRRSTSSYSKLTIFALLVFAVVLYFVYLYGYQVVINKFSELVKKSE